MDKRQSRFADLSILCGEMLFIFGLYYTFDYFNIIRYFSININVLITKIC